MYCDYSCQNNMKGTIIYGKGGRTNFIHIEQSDKEYSNKTETP